MRVRTLEPLLKTNPFFKGMDRKQLELLVGCSTNIRFQKGEYIFQEGEKADRFYIIREGHVSMELTGEDGSTIPVSHLTAGNILGWSWLFPPFTWQFDARCEDLVRVVALNADCVNAKCKEVPELGYELMKRFANIVVYRLQDTRRQLIAKSAEY